MASKEEGTHEEDDARFQMMGLKKTNSGSMPLGSLPLLHLKLLRQRPYKYIQKHSQPTAAEDVAPD